MRSEGARHDRRTAVFLDCDPGWSVSFFAICFGELSLA